MVSLIKKKKKGRVYYYLAESQRVNGKPRIVWQKYLGTPERLKAILQQGEEGITPQEIQCFEFGAVVALLRSQRSSG